MSIEELIKLWTEFKEYIVKNIPNYTDNDFSFAAFMYWLEELRKKIL